MKLPRFVLSLRALMLVVLLSGLVLAYRVDLGRRRAALQLEIARQFELTDKILGEAEIDANSHVSRLNLPGLGRKGMGSRSANSSEIYWQRSLQLSYTAGLEKRPVVGLRILGDSWDLRMKFIVVYDLERTQPEDPRAAAPGLSGRGLGLSGRLRQGFLL